MANSIFRVLLAAVTTASYAALAMVASPAWAQSVGAAASFAIVGGSGVSANGSGSVIDGDVGVSPGTSITGFPANATIVPPFTTHADPDGLAIAAQTSVTALYVALAGAGPCTPLGMQLDTVNVGPGVYCFSSTADLAANGTFTLNGAGLYIFQVGSGLTANALSNMQLNGVDPCNVFWQVTSMATLNGSTFAGNVVAQAAVTMGAGTMILPVSLSGRALATSAGAVTLAGFDTIQGCSESPTPTASATATETATGTATTTPVDTLTSTATATTTATATSTATETITQTPADTSTATCSPTSTATATSTDSATATATRTVTATASTTPTATETRTATPTRTPGPPILHITKSAPSGVAAGATLVYTLAYSNVGGATATTVLITETVPAHTTFNVAASTAGWSCPDGSPPATLCTLAVPNVPAGGQGTVVFAVRVDKPAGAGAIFNSVLIGSAEGPGGGDSVATVVGTQAPALDSWGFTAALLTLVGIASIAVRRARRV